jgi:hypothetical protein
MSKLITKKHTLNVVEGIECTLADLLKNFCRELCIEGHDIDTEYDTIEIKIGNKAADPNKIAVKFKFDPDTVSDNLVNAAREVKLT